jgi:hypothetical protein
MPMKAIMIATFVLVVLTGCGGGAGGGGGVAAPPPPPPPPPPPSGASGQISVTVVDVFGAPIESANVYIYTDNGALSRRTDVDGSAQFANVPAGERPVSASGGDALRGAFFGAEIVELTAGVLMELELTALPSANPTLGASIAGIDPAVASADGRSLTLRLTLLQVQDHNGWGGVPLTLLPCMPDPANDLTTFRADCVEGPPGFDAAYEVVDPPASEGVEFDRLDSAEPFAAGLSIDQSRRIVEGDPMDLRLFGLKYLIRNLATDTLSLSAYAADDATSGELSLLATQPVTVLATDVDTSTYDAIDDLAGLEGGASPLLAALDRTIDMIAASPPTAGQRRAVAVLTDGHDDTCGTIEQCALARQTIVEQSVANGLDVVMLVLPGGTDDDRCRIAELVADVRGRAYWLEDAGQLPVLLGMLPEVLSGRSERADVTLRIEADAEGTFVSGRTVHGVLQPEICPWDCYPVTFPIAVRIP